MEHLYRTKLLLRTSTGYPSCKPLALSHLSHEALPIICIVEFPTDRRNWTDMVKKHGLGEASIYLTPCESASKLSVSQYLLLRSFWIPYSSATPKDPKEWGIKRIDEAQKWLEDNRDWLTYLENLSPITDSPAPPLGLGTFAYAWFTHHQVISLPEQYEQGEEDKNVSYSPISSRLRSSDNKTHLHGRESSPTPLGKKGYQTPPDQLAEDSSYAAVGGLAQAVGKMGLAENPQKSPSQASTGASGSEYKMSPGSARRAFPKVEDEQIVNGFLIALLASICMYHTGVKLQWSPVRKSFKFGRKDAEQASADKPYLFEARTDGHLASRNPGPNDVKSSAVIVEVKPTNRTYNNRVIYQATAQMAAWIF